jgi:hypothetical protein
MLRFRRIAQSTEVRLNPRLALQIIQFSEVTLKTQYIQAKPPCGSHRVAFIADLVEKGRQSNFWAHLSESTDKANLTACLTAQAMQQSVTTSLVPEVSCHQISALS